MVVVWAALLLCLDASAAAPPASWTTYGNGPTRTGGAAATTTTLNGAANALYVADAFGRLHALDLTTGAEHDSWPVRVFSDFRRELAWGALTLADGAVYVPTASYCDSPSMGGVYRVDLASRDVGFWISVPADQGGGGGVWGWGGTAYSPGDDALYAVTANAFDGGSNTGDDFSESAGYGEHLVKLAPDLSVEDSNHPADLTTPADLDFVSSPVVFYRTGCGELVVGAGSRVYFWSGGRLSMLVSLPRQTSSTRLASTTVATLTDGAIKDVDPIPGGVAVLVSTRIHGQGWDTAPPVLIVTGTTLQTVTLPTARGRLLAQGLTAAWPKLTVNATDFANPARAAVWNTPDGGATWATG